MTNDAFPHQLRQYLEKRGIAGPWLLEGASSRDFSGAVVIPALAEEKSLFLTLDSLAANPPEILARFLTVVVVNHPADAGGAVKEENRRTLCRLAGFSGDLPLAWVDAASPGRELPVGEGVGLARKLGFDLVLDRLAWRSAPPLLIALDADTLVRPDYLAAIEDHFRRMPEGGAIVPFCHQRGETPEQDLAIAHYELFLRSYALGLALAGSPYAFPTVGSAMACRAGAYLRAGGMNRRTAGEDFYFLQQLAKAAGVAPLRGTVVRPSARSSRRTPFGTGRSVARLLAGGLQALHFYPADSFRLLGAWLALADAAWQEPATTILPAARELSPDLGAYLERAGLLVVWPRLQRQHHTRSAFCKAFHAWFDALKTRKLLHLLSCGPLPCQPPDLALPPLLSWGGFPATTDLLAQLTLLRGCPAPPGPADESENEIGLCLRRCNVVGFGSAPLQAADMNRGLI